MRESVIYRFSFLIYKVPPYTRKDTPDGMPS